MDAPQGRAGDAEDEADEVEGCDADVGGCVRGAERVADAEEGGGGGGGREAGVEHGGELAQRERPHDRLL